MKMLGYGGVCPACKKYQTGSLYPGKTPRCNFCDTASALQLMTLFEATAQRVREQLDKGSTNAKHVEAVIAHLATEPAAAKFQQDFISELAPGRTIDMNKFAKNINRAQGADKICVDNAMKAAGCSLPANCPVGEKFTFEMPYILSAAGWAQHKSCIGSGFLDYPLVSFLNEVKASKPTAHVAYFVVWSKDAGSTASHAIYLIVKKGGGEAWIVDQQCQPNEYTSGYCEAWKSPAGKVIKEATGRMCSLDLSTGKRSDYSKMTVDLG